MNTYEALEAFVIPNLGVDHIKPIKISYDFKTNAENAKKENDTMPVKPNDTKKNAIPQPVRINQYDKATVVHWDDGTYTSVVCGEHDSNNLYAAYAAALVKKLYGSTSAVHKLVDRHEGNYLDRIEEEEKQKKRAEQAEAEKRNKKRKIASYMKQINAIQQALKELTTEE